MAVKSKEEAHKSVLAEAAQLVSTDRQAIYGPPQQNFQRWSDLCETCEIHVTPKDLAMIMVLGKLARNVHQTKRDNIVDACGYLEIFEMLDK